MRTWVKVTIAGVALAVLGFAALAGTGAYYFLRHLETKSATEAEVKPDFAAIRARFTGRPPIVDIIDLQSGDVRVNRLAHPEGRRAETLHVLTWAGEEEKLLRTDVPLWLMRFSSVNILSHLGIAPSKYRLTVEDLKRYGPGLVVDFTQVGRTQVLIWLE